MIDSHPLMQEYGVDAATLAAMSVMMLSGKMFFRYELARCQDQFVLYDVDVRYRMVRLLALNTCTSFR